MEENNNEELIQKFLSTAQEDNLEEMIQLVEQMIEKGISLDIRDEEGMKKKKFQFLVLSFFFFFCRLSKIQENRFEFKRKCQKMKEKHPSTVCENKNLTEDILKLFLKTIPKSKFKIMMEIIELLLEKQPNYTDGLLGACTSEISTI